MEEKKLPVSKYDVINKTRRKLVQKCVDDPFDMDSLEKLFNVPDDLYIQFSSSTEAALPVGRRTPSPIRRFEGVKFNPTQKYF